MATINPVDDSTVRFCGFDWTVFAQSGTLQIATDCAARFTVRKGVACKHDIVSHRNPLPERCFLVGKFFTELRRTFHIRFRVFVLPGAPTDALWTDLFQLMPFPDQDPRTKAFLEPFPSPMLGLYVTHERGKEFFSWQTRFDPKKITTDGNPNWLERGRVPMERGRYVSWDVSCLDSQGQAGGALKIVMDQGMPSQHIVCDVRDTPIGFNNEKPSYPSLGVYRDHLHNPNDVLSVIFDHFALRL